MTTLQDTLKLGSLSVPSRIFMAPLTRCRADLGTNLPNDLMKQYYVQRASAGLVITEFTSIANDAITFHREPCIADDAQTAKWKEIVDAVHAAGGRIFCQIAHGGRAAHPSCNGGKPGVAPSPIALTHRCGKDFNPSAEEVAYADPPEELTDAAADAIVAKFREAARRAVHVAGFDGVEVHAANGYLIDQFLCATSNKRPNGKYAGTSLETRAGFLKAVLKEVTAEVGADRVGMRISPLNSYQDMHRGETAPDEVKFIASIANDFGLAYLHVMRADFFGQQKGDVITPARETLKGPALLVNMGFEVDEAKEGVAAGRFDAVAFGTKFLANPDLPARIAAGAALNDPKADLFYTGKVGDLTYTGPEGYTDYPPLTPN